MTLAYYNKHDPFAAAWLRELIKEGVIAPGWVDERDIQDVMPNEVRGFTQCHFFAGIGVWSLALRLAGWPDDRPIWTGSCPCQPFSAAGKGGGFDDERHLWPAWFHLITHGKLGAVPLVGEQVASKDGRAWFDLVSDDMEGLDHACGAVDFSAAVVGAPFIGQRLYWLAATDDARRKGWAPEERSGSADQRSAGPNGLAGGLAAPESLNSRAGLCNHGSAGDTWIGVNQPGHGGGAGGLAATTSERSLSGSHSGLHSGESGAGSWNGESERSGNFGSAPITRPERGDRIPLHPVEYWRNADWVLCRDPDGARFRPVEPTHVVMVDAGAVGEHLVDGGRTGQTQTVRPFPLAAKGEYRNRLNEVRGAGNALNVSQATCFIEAVMTLL